MNTKISLGAVQLAGSYAVTISSFDSKKIEKDGRRVTFLPPKDSTAELMLPNVPISLELMNAVENAVSRAYNVTQITMSKGTSTVNRGLPEMMDKVEEQEEREKKENQEIEKIVQEVLRQKKGTKSHVLNTVGDIIEILEIPLIELHSLPLFLLNRYVTEHSITEKFITLLEKYAPLSLSLSYISSVIFSSVNEKYYVSVDIKQNVDTKVLLQKHDLNATFSTAHLQNFLIYILRLPKNEQDIFLELSLKSIGFVLYSLSKESIKNFVTYTAIPIQIQFSKSVEYTTSTEYTIKHRHKIQHNTKIIPILRTNTKIYRKNTPLLIMPNHIIANAHKKNAVIVKNSSCSDEMCYVSAMLFPTIIQLFFIAKEEQAEEVEGKNPVEYSHYDKENNRSLTSIHSLYDSDSTKTIKQVFFNNYSYYFVLVQSILGQYSIVQKNDTNRVEPLKEDIYSLLFSLYTQYTKENILVQEDSRLVRENTLLYAFAMHALCGIELTQIVQDVQHYTLEEITRLKKYSIFFIILFRSDYVYSAKSVYIVTFWLQYFSPIKFYLFKRLYTLACDIEKIHNDIDIKELFSNKAVCNAFVTITDIDFIAIRKYLETITNKKAFVLILQKTLLSR